MLNYILNSEVQSLLIKSMDYSSLKNSVLADNIANAGTPGFKRSEVIFQKNIRKVLEKQKNHDKINIANPHYIDKYPKFDTITEYEPKIIKINNTSARNDGNNVDVDVEMAKLTKNDVYYDTLSRCMNNEIRLLRMAITGRS